MLKQIIKIKKLLLTILVIVSFGASYASFAGALAGGPAPCATTGSTSTVGSACYDIATICQSPSSAVKKLCSDIPSGCNYITTATAKVACAFQAISFSCVDSTYATYLGNTCSDISSLCQNPTSTGAVIIACSGFVSICSSSSTTFCNGGSPNPGNYSGADACYDPAVGFTFLCGTGAPKGNLTSNAPVVDTKFATESGASAPFGFITGQCYQAELITSGNYVNQLGWVQQSDCTASALSPSTPPAVTTQLPNLGLGSADASPDPNHCKQASSAKTPSNCLVSAYINPFIRFLNVLIGLVVVISVVIGGIQYSMSRDNPEAVKAAKKRIMNAIIGLVAYFLLYAFLNFIIPGGV